MRGIPKKKNFGHDASNFGLFFPKKFFVCLVFWCFQSIKIFHMFGVWSFYLKKNKNILKISKTKQRIMMTENLSAYVHYNVSKFVCVCISIRKSCKN
jgi:hypothetical protein